MTAVGVIPARFEASRFPGKPLTRIAGLPMIQRVWEGARTAKSLRGVVVATDDPRIEAACQAFGAEVAMTRPDHPTGTDRIAEVAVATEDEVVVNIQGDEPLIEGFVIDAAVEALSDAPDAVMSTVVHAAEPQALSDPNRVKVVMDRRGDALYFSRATIPYLREPEAAPVVYQHVGLYAYRRPFLLDFVSLERTPAERAEALEQLRAMEHGYRIRCAVVEGWRSVPVDVPADVETVEQRLREAERA